MIICFIHICSTNKRNAVNKCDYKQKKLPDIVRSSIEKFGCMGCGKCLSKTGMAIFEGVPLCGRVASNSLGESPRSIRGNIVSPEEARVICDIVKGML